MAEEYGKVNDEPQMGAIKNVLGYILILGGVGVLVWVFINVYGLFNHPEKLMDFQKLVSSNLETILSASEKEGVKIVVPSEVLSYFIPICLLMIAAGIGGKLISGGAKVLGSDIQKNVKKDR